jgi:hypothetical protein
MQTKITLTLKSRTDLSHITKFGQCNDEDLTAKFAKWPETPQKVLEIV